MEIVQDGVDTTPPARNHTMQRFLTHFIQNVNLSLLENRTMSPRSTFLRTPMMFLNSGLDRRNPLLVKRTDTQDAPPPAANAADSRMTGQTLP
eukprot:4714649-Pyramimonas_sp.AAC.1